LGLLRFLGLLRLSLELSGLAAQQGSGDEQSQKGCRKLGQKRRPAVHLEHCDLIDKHTA
jgi:hypothetical protein